jgi:hypothetical protein
VNMSVTLRNYGLSTGLNIGVELVSLNGSAQVLSPCLMLTRFSQEAITQRFRNCIQDNGGCTTHSDDKTIMQNLSSGSDNVQ